MSWLPSAVAAAEPLPTEVVVGLGRRDDADLDVDRPASVARAASDGARRQAEHAVRALYDAHYRHVARLAYLLVGDPHHAEDLAHEAFARLFASWGRLADPDRALGYLRATTVNLAHSAHRRERTRRRHLAVPAVMAGHLTAPSAEDTALSREGRADVVVALSALPERQRTAVVLRHWLRMTEGEIADAMGCSVGSVRTHLSRGHATLAKHLRDLDTRDDPIDRTGDDDHHG